MRTSHDSANDTRAFVESAEPSPRPASRLSPSRWRPRSCRLRLGQPCRAGARRRAHVLYSSLPARAVRAPGGRRPGRATAGAGRRPRARRGAAGAARGAGQRRVRPRLVGPGPWSRPTLTPGAQTRARSPTWASSTSAARPCRSSDQQGGPPPGLARRRARQPDASAPGPPATRSPEALLSARRRTFLRLVPGRPSRQARPWWMGSRLGSLPSVAIVATPRVRAELATRLARRGKSRIAPIPVTCDDPDTVLDAARSWPTTPTLPDDLGWPSASYAQLLAGLGRRCRRRGSSPATACWSGRRSVAARDRRLRCSRRFAAAAARGPEAGQRRPTLRPHWAAPGELEARQPGAPVGYESVRVGRCDRPRAASATAGPADRAVVIAAGAAAARRRSVLGDLHRSGNRRPAPVPLQPSTAARAPASGIAHAAEPF